MAGKGEMARSEVMDVGVVLRRAPGVTRWQKWVWSPVGILPATGQPEWTVLREEGEVTDYLAATVPVELHRSEVEAYKVSLSMDPPSAFVMLRKDEGEGPGDVSVFGVTVSAFEAQDYQDSGDEIVEPVPLPPPVLAWVAAFCKAHDHEEPFVKRQRDKKRVDLHEDGVGDARIRQEADVYRSPASMKPGRR